MIGAVDRLRTRIGIRCIAPFGLVVFGILSLLTPAAGQHPLINDWLALQPTNLAEVPALDSPRVALAAKAVDDWACRLAWDSAAATSEGRLSQIATLIDAKQRIDKQLEQALQWRAEAAVLDREAICDYLGWMSGLIDVSGRLRYALRDAIEQATYALSDSEAALDQMIAMLEEHQVIVGVEELAYILSDPDPDSTVRPFPPATKRRILRLIGAVRSPALLSVLFNFIEQESTPAELVLDAAEAIREIGMPQSPAPRGRADAAAREPVITPRTLQIILDRIRVKQLSAASRQRLFELQTWLQTRIRRGVIDDRFRVGAIEMQPGDWVLMRNPSPYNRFTSHRPGLFTHVGLVAVDQDPSGVRRFVVVDIPERGERIPATNVERFLDRTLHYLILRHPDRRVAAKMSNLARSVIGNESRFDLQFQTNRVEALRGQFKPGPLIHTYCAGLLLLAAQETGEPIRDFFPLREGPAEGNCAANLAKLGLAIGADFVSPTGALFSPKLEIVGRCEPMYEPEREIREAIFDAFAQSMVERELSVSPNLLQSLRERVAGIAGQHPWLARAFAKANHVHEQTDLESAARAAAVVETLDEIVETASREFVAARLAITAAAEEWPRDSAVVKPFERLRRRHAPLVRRFVQDELSPYVLRTELVTYYGREGIRQIDERFFTTSARPGSP